MQKAQWDFQNKGKSGWTDKSSFNCFGSPTVESDFKMGILNDLINFRQKNYNNSGVQLQTSNFSSIYLSFSLTSDQPKKL